MLGAWRTCKAPSRLRPSAAAAPSWFPAETAEAAPAPVAVEAPLPPEERTYEGVSREDGTWVADIKFDGEEIKRLGTYENAGAAAWAYDAAREERGLPPVNFPLRAMAPAPTNEAPAPAEDEEAPPPVTTEADAPIDAVEPATPGAASARHHRRPCRHRRKSRTSRRASAWAAVCTDLVDAGKTARGRRGLWCRARCGDAEEDISRPLTEPARRGRQGLPAPVPDEAPFQVLVPQEGEWGARAGAGRRASMWAGDPGSAPGATRRRRRPRVPPTPMLLAHQRKPVNFPGEEEATRAAFPDIIVTGRAPTSRLESRPAAPRAEARSRRALRVRPRRAKQERPSCRPPRLPRHPRGSARGPTTTRRPRRTHGCKRS